MSKFLVLLLAFNISGWQASMYKKICDYLQSPIYPQSEIHFIDKQTAYFSSVGAFNDPGKKQEFVAHDIKSMPDWFFNIRYHNKIFNELWHKDIHNGLPCNTFIGNNILLHLETAGIIKTEIIFKVNFNTTDTPLGTVSIVNFDNSFNSNLVNDFRLVMWIFPHPKIKNLSIVVFQGYLKSKRDIYFFDNYFRWQLDNILQNFGERFLVAANGGK